MQFLALMTRRAGHRLCWLAAPLMHEVCITMSGLTWVELATGDGEGGGGRQGWGTESCGGGLDKFLHGGVVMMGLYWGKEAVSKGLYLWGYSTYSALDGKRTIYQPSPTCPPPDSNMDGPTPNIPHYMSMQPLHPFLSVVDMKSNAAPTLYP